MAEEQKKKEQVPEFVQQVVLIAAVVVGVCAFVSVCVVGWSVAQWVEHTYPSPPTSSYNALQGRVWILERKLDGAWEGK